VLANDQIPLVDCRPPLLQEGEAARREAAQERSGQRKRARCKSSVVHFLKMIRVTAVGAGGGGTLLDSGATDLGRPKKEGEKATTVKVELAGGQIVDVEMNDEGALLLAAAAQSILPLTEYCLLTRSTQRT
jgi:hypothetical protein